MNKAIDTATTSTAMRYHELCVGEGREECPATDIWMCIRGHQQPTCEEALEFIKRDNSNVVGHVKSVSELTAAEACSFYDFTHVADWPIFSRKDVSDLQDKTCGGCSWSDVVGNDVCLVCQRKTMERADIDYYDFAKVEVK